MAKRRCDAVTYSKDQKRVIRCERDETPEHDDHHGYDPKTGERYDWRTWAGR